MLGEGGDVKRFSPAWVLFFLAPLTAEYVSGSSPYLNPFVLVANLLLYGAGTLFLGIASAERDISFRVGSTVEICGGKRNHFVLDIGFAADIVWQGQPRAVVLWRAHGGISSERAATVDEKTDDAGKPLVIKLPPQPKFRANGFLACPASVILGEMEFRQFIR